MPRALSKIIYNYCNILIISVIINVILLYVSLNYFSALLLFSFCCNIFVSLIVAFKIPRRFSTEDTVNDIENFLRPH